MESSSDWGTLKEEVNLYLKHKKIAVGIAVVFIVSFFSIIIFLAYRSGFNFKDSSANSSTNPLNFSFLGAGQNQQSVQGANTQLYGAAEPPPQASISATQIPTISTSPTSVPPTSTPNPTPTPTHAPAATDTPTPTQTPTPSVTPSPTLTPTAIPTPTLTPEITP